MTDADTIDPATDRLWPTYGDPSDLADVEAVPLAARGLPASTYHAVLRAAALWPDRVAARVLPDGEHWDRPQDVTFAALAAQVTRTANALRGVGVSRHDAVALLSPNTAGLIPALLGAQAAGIAAPVNPVLREHQVEELIARAGARILVAAGPALSTAIWDLARAVASRLGMTALLALEPPRPDSPAPDLDPLPGVHVAYLADLAADQPGDRLVGDGAPAADDVAAFFHTGGTTGLPKIAAHTHRNEIADAWAVAAMTDLGPDAVILAALPLFHVNALVVTLLAPLLRGRPVVWAGPLGYRDQAFIAAFWRVVERYRIAAMSGVPSVYAGLARLPVDADIASLHFCIVGAAPLPRAVVEAWHDRTGLPLLEGYGLTEATCASSRSFPGSIVAGSVGQRLPYQQVKAVEIDADTGAWTDLPPGRTGTVAIAGPTVFPGYLVGRGPDGRPAVDGLGKLHDGWLDTGDVGSVDTEGFLRLSGRAKDVIIRGGHNIDPRFVEDSLRSHPAVTDAAAVGRIDQHSGEVPVVYVTVREPVDPAELIAWAADHVAEPAAAPKDVVVIPELPHTTVGKLHKVPLRLDAARRELATRIVGLGIAVPDDGTWCTDVGGRITVTLTIPDPRTGAATADLLDRYAIDHQLQVADPAATAARSRS